MAPYLDDDAVEMDSAALDEVHTAIKNLVLQGSLVRVKIWSEDGTIIYSDEPRLIGQQFDLGDDELAVLLNGGQGAEVSDLSEPENQYETESKLLEVYTHAETESGTPLLFETYFRYSGVTDVGQQLWSQFAPITLGALIVLELVQIPLAWSMARRLHASQQDQERLLRAALDASDTERRRIASDLHDGVVQELAGVSLALAAQGQARGRGPGTGGPSLGRHPLEHQIPAVPAGRDLPGESRGGGSAVGGRRSPERARRSRDLDSSRRRPRRRTASTSRRRPWRTGSPRRRSATSCRTRRPPRSE